MSRSSASPVLERLHDADPVIPAGATASSLCANCDHAPGCILPRASSLPIIHCEEWAAAGPEPEASARFIARLHARETAAQPAAAALQIKGLCATCESFTTCAFAKPDGGVWHCEEYA